MEKMTKKEMFNQILTNYNLTESEKEFIQHEIELLTKKNRSNGKPTKTQIENEKIMDLILDKMEIGTDYTVTEIQALLEDSISNQKASALLKKLATAELVTRTSVKGKALYHKN